LFRFLVWKYNKRKW